MFLADLLPAVGDATSCRAVRRVLTELFAHAPATGTGTVVYTGSTARMIAELDLACGDHTAAVEHFQQGLQIDTALGAEPYVTCGNLGLAKALRATGDLPRAIAYARTAAAQAHRLDLPGPLGTADTLLADLTAHLRANDPLTAREREVISLVAKAHTHHRKPHPPNPRQNPPQHPHRTHPLVSPTTTTLNAASRPR